MKNLIISTSMVVALLATSSQSFAVANLTGFSVTSETSTVSPFVPAPSLPEQEDFITEARAGAGAGGAGGAGQFGEDGPILHENYRSSTPPGTPPSTFPRPQPIIQEFGGCGYYVETADYTDCEIPR